MSHQDYWNIKLIFIFQDAINLYNTLSPEARYGIREINDGDFNHLDFIYGRHAKQYVYDRIINLFDTFPNKT